MSYSRAVIVGGGFAGLLSARVLADTFQQVVLIDRDHIPPDATIRAGVPQAHHQHHLLPGGLEILNRLFPDLGPDLDRQGGKIAGPSDWFAYTPHGKTYRLSRKQTEPIEGSAPLRMQSRSLLEHVIRGYVERIANVEVRYETRVDEPRFEGDRIAGVVTSQGESINADLVIDASGRVSRTLGWLAKLGYEVPPASVIECDFAYSSVFYRPADPDAFAGTGFLISSARTGNYVKRGGSLVKIEDDKWLVTLAGRLGDHPPADIDGINQYIATLHAPHIGELLRDAEPVSQPHQYKFPRSVNRHYESLEAFPEGLLPIGDAICHINPGYAQGMSSVCRQVSVLSELLDPTREDQPPPHDLWRAFFPAVFEQTRAPWLFAALSDFSKKGTTGDFPEHEKDVIKKLKQLSTQADEGDMAAARLVDQVFDMQLPLSTLAAV